MQIRTAREQVAANVRAEAARARRTATDIAEAVGISQASVTRRLNADQPFTVDELVATAQFLGVPLAVLLEGTSHLAQAG